MKIALLGYGKMGKAIEKIALQRGHQVVLRVNKDTKKYDITQAEVAIEFSTPQSAFPNLKNALEHGVPVVCGTTGWLKNYSEAVKICQKAQSGLLYASNFSIGVNIFFELNKKLAEMMRNLGYAPAIEEVHHVHKLDAPSGTAITLAEQIIERSDKQGWRLSAEGVSADLLPITSKREGEVPGTHIVSYRSEVDMISIEHQAFSREGFALGALLAAEWIQGKSGVFTMQDVLAL